MSTHEYFKENKCQDSWKVKGMKKDVSQIEFVRSEYHFVSLRQVVYLAVVFGSCSCDRSSKPADRICTLKTF